MAHSSRKRRSGRRNTPPLPILLIILAAALFSWYRSSASVPAAAAPSAVSLDTIPAYSGAPYVELDGNEPGFTDADLTTVSFEHYSELDTLGRCGPAYACIGQDLMPTSERGNISRVKPTGWVQAQYDCVDGSSLYNRCHLIAFQLTAEDANWKNLITGTRYMNVTGMLPFENEAADYIRETGNHVLYRVTPIFESDNLVASGVEMEALSVEDGGTGVRYHVFVYNVQPGIEIDYATGESRLAPTASVLPQKQESAKPHKRLGASCKKERE